MTSQTSDFKLPPEDKERVIHLTHEVFIPHLQRAIEEARAKAPFTEVISAASSAYADMLDQTIGREAAVSLIKSLAQHLEGRPVKKTPDA
jgi:hypothetical protein